MESDRFEWGTGVEEYFTWIHHRWNVRSSKEIIQDNPREVDSFDPEEVEDFIPPQDGGLGNPLMNIGVKKEDARRDCVDLEFPVIFGWVPAERGGEKIHDQPFAIPIDGWHRIARAYWDDHGELPCVVLTKDESESVHCFV